MFVFQLVFMDDTWVGFCCMHVNSACVNQKRDTVAKIQSQNHLLSVDDKWPFYKINEHLYLGYNEQEVVAYLLIIQIYTSNIEKLETLV